MKEPTKRFLSHTWLEWLNLLFFQWFFVRLGGLVEHKKVLAWGFRYWAIPTSGWGTELLFTEDKVNWFQFIGSCK